MTTHFVVNPYSAGGATGRRSSKVEAAARRAFPDVLFHYTERPGHAVELVGACGGAEMVVSVGGDGTANEVANGLARLAPSERPALGVLPAGTGSDLVKTLGMPRDLTAAIGVLKDGERRRCDWMRARYHDGERVCINVAGFGQQGAIVARANQSSKWLGGTATFALATARVALSWKAPEVEVSWDGPEGAGSWSGRLGSTFVGNGRFCGGGMDLGPGSMSDGLVEMLLIPDLPLPTLIRHVPKLYNGTMRSVPEIVFARVSQIETLSDADVLVDLDGEQPGSLPATFQVEEGAVEIVGLWPDDIGLK